MPARVVDGYAAELPALIAGEQLRAINAVMAGTGTMHDDARREYLASLERTANHGTTPRGHVVRLRSAAAVASVLGGMGVDVSAVEGAAS